MDLPVFARIPLVTDGWRDAKFVRLGVIAPPSPLRNGLFRMSCGEGTLDRSGLLRVITRITPVVSVEFRHKELRQSFNELGDSFVRGWPNKERHTSIQTT